MYHMLRVMLRVQHSTTRGPLGAPIPQRSAEMLSMARMGLLCSLSVYVLVCSLALRVCTGSSEGVRVPRMGS